MTTSEQVARLTDPRPFCDHGTWAGTCSKEKHAAILNAEFTAVLEYTRQTDAGVLCACCRFNYTI